MDRHLARMQIHWSFVEFSKLNLNLRRNRIIGKKWILAVSRNYRFLQSICKQGILRVKICHTVARYCRPSSMATGNDSVLTAWQALGKHSNDIRAGHKCICDYWRIWYNFLFCYNCAKAMLIYSMLIINLYPWTSVRSALEKYWSSSCFLHIYGPSCRRD